jgi:poly(A) polymerase
MVCKEALKNPIFKTVSEVCQREQMETYVIGGYVRDYFLNRVHDMDIDIVTVGNGIHLAVKISEALGKGSKVQVFKKIRNGSYQLSRYGP